MCARLYVCVCVCLLTRPLCNNELAHAPILRLMLWEVIFVHGVRVLSADRRFGIGIERGHSGRQKAYAVTCNWYLRPTSTVVYIHRRRRRRHRRRRDDSGRACDSHTPTNRHAYS